MPTSLRSRFGRIRDATLRLADPLSPEDCQAQSMPEASPVKWHLAHTTWFFETFVLGRPDAPSRLFNSYYLSLGDPFPRSDRGLLTRPALHDVLRWRRNVDREVLRRLDDPRLAPLIELGLQHEQQHQELILSDVKHLLSLNPAQPAYAPGTSKAPPAGQAPLEWIEVPGGLVEIGDPGTSGFAYDNERPRHRRHLEPFALASRPASCGEYLSFVLDGGYARPELWMSDGWDLARREGWMAPLYWRREPEGWTVFTLQGRRPLDPREPVCHLSWYEADAFARWSGARLPGEDEWEAAAPDLPPRGDGRVLHPARTGDVWEWTSSAYAPYPGYRAPEGPVGEYNAKFMSGRYVLRGRSCVTPVRHERRSYRNYFAPDARWQFAGVRLARWDWNISRRGASSLGNSNRRRRP